jgi:hypothetical protein
MARILTVFVIAVILAACSPDPSPPREPSPYFGTKLRLSGDVYTRRINFDPDNIGESLLYLFSKTSSLVTYHKAGNNLDLAIFDGGLGGSGKIEKGKFSYFIEAPDEDSLTPINELSLELLLAATSLPNNVDLPEIDISPNTAQAVFLSLIITGNPEYIFMNREKIEFDLPSFQIIAETASYIYVDENVTITVPAFTYDTSVMNIPVNLTTGKINLNLKEGWNTIHSTLIVTLSITIQDFLESTLVDLDSVEASGDLNIKVRNPSSLYWVLNSIDDKSFPFP